MHIHPSVCTKRTSQIFKNVFQCFKSKRYSSISSQSQIDLIQRRNHLFDQEEKRQKEDVGRIDKFTVVVDHYTKYVALTMNRGLSTPYDCARHISETAANESGLALLNSDVLVDMHSPISSKNIRCKLSLLTFKDEDPFHVNKAFWRTCSIMLGAVISRSFNDSIVPQLHSFPSPDVSSGSFVYDVQLPLNEWNPTADELRLLSAEMIGFSRQGKVIKKLVVGEELALDIFEGSSYKQQQIPHIASTNDGNVSLYRIGDHIDISKGPLLGNTNFLGRCTVAAVHKIKSDEGEFYRFQGVALPHGIMLNHFAYGVLEKRARKLNQGALPGQVRQRQLQIQTEEAAKGDDDTDESLDKLIEYIESS